MMMEHGSGGFNLLLSIMIYYCWIFVRKINIGNTIGTIPMYYKGSRYNIPMTFWVVDLYPHHPPVAYVTPTPNMVIKQKHRHVDDTGKCYLPYLANWNPATSDLYELVNQLSAVFGSDPPVYQKSANTPSVTQPQTNPMTSMYGSTTFPPSTNTSMYGSSMSQPTVNPTTTPYPSNTYGSSHPPPFMGTSYYGGSTSNMYNTLPPVPRKPTIEELKEQLTAKIRQQLQNTTVKEYGSKIEAEVKQQNQLIAREKQLELIEQRMNSDMTQFARDMENLNQKKVALENWITNDQTKPIDVDTIINPQDMQSKQILDITSEELAIDDWIYYLEKKLHAKQISLDEWMEQIRELSRQQFLKKALIKKMAQMN